MDIREQNINDLLAVEALLYEVHKTQSKKWDMNVWAKRTYDKKTKEYPKVEQPRDHCDTSACFAGWCTVVVERLKLRFSPTGMYASVVDKITNTTNVIAIQNALGLTGDQAWNLCYKDMNASAKDKAKVVGKIAKNMADEYGYDIVTVYE